jgi:hypothetical protein
MKISETRTQHPLSSSSQFIFKSPTNFNTLPHPTTPHFYSERQEKLADVKKGTLVALEVIYLQ